MRCLESASRGDAGGIWKNEVWFIGLSLLGLILYGFLMNWIGFMLSTLLYMGGMLLFLGERSPVLVGGWAFGVTLIMYWVFRLFCRWICRRTILLRDETEWNPFSPSSLTHLISKQFC